MQSEKERHQMEITKIKQFIVIAEEESISKAADRLYISQPALSKSLSILENELSCTLFDRVGRRLILNSQGKRFMVYARQISDILDTVKREFSEQSIGALNIGGTGNYFSFILAPYFKSEIQPIRVFPLDKEEAISKLLSGAMDIVITDDNTNSIRNTSGINKILVLREQLLLSVPINNEISKKKSISIEEVCALHPVKQLGDRELNTWIDQVLEYNSLKMDWMMELDEQTLKILMLQDSKPKLYHFISSSSFLSAESRKEYIRTRSLVKVTGKYTDRMIYLCFLEKNKDKIADFLETIQHIYDYM